jgi:hypothetical protein
MIYSKGKNRNAKPFTRSNLEFWQSHGRGVGSKQTISSELLDNNFLTNKQLNHHLAPGVTDDDGDAFFAGCKN